MKYIYISFAGMLGVSAFFAGVLALVSSSSAQDITPPYIDTDCGTWINDEWVPNGRCTPDDTRRRHVAVAGQITSVNGNLVTVARSTGSIVINDQPALQRQQTGKVAVGRQIVAYGYWLGGNFYATAIY